MQPGQHVRYAVLIPAYRPSAGLIALVHDLLDRGVPALLVVDDGSGPEFRATFDQVAALPNVQVLRHATNLGKGAALKTGIDHARREFPELSGLVTADADGQHHPEDIERVAASMLRHPESLVLGARTFDASVPLRSRIGNILTRRLMQALAGAKLQDTQTGLRGIPAAMFAPLLLVEARGYEFELEMLIAARQRGVPIVEEPIRTIYEPGNRSSHFNPLTDSMKIYFVLLRFSSVSLLTALLDNLVFYFVWKRTGFVLESQVAGRLVAVIFNYTMVRKTVFASREANEVLLPKYLLLVATSGTASYLGIQFLNAHFGVSAMPAKLFVETLLFFANFLIQRKFIFREAQPGTGRLFTRLILAVLAALVALEIYGFSTSGVFEQQIWSPEGSVRVMWFAALYAGVSTALLILVPWLFVPLAATLLAVLTTIFLGPAPVLAVAFFLISAWALGGLVLGGQGGARKSKHALPVLVGMAIYIFLMPFAARTGVNYPWVYGVILALPVLANLRGVRRLLPELLRAPARCELRTSGERLSVAALVFVVITHWFAMLKPEASADGLSMHLAVPVNIAANHIMTFEPGRYLWAVMPMGADFTYSIVYLLGGEMASRLLNFTILLLLLVMLYGVLRRWLSPALAWLLVALFATTPLVQMATGSLFVENLLAAMILGAMLGIWSFGESGQRRLLYAAALLGGTAIAIKVGAIAFVLPATLCAAVEVRRHIRQTGARWVFALVLLLAAAAPPYAIAWRKTGNPLFPFLNEKYHSRLLDPQADIQDKRFRKPLTWSLPYDLTFRSNRTYEGQDGTFGFQYLILAPLALLALLVATRRQAVAAAFVALTAIVLILRSEPNARYLYPALPLLSIPFAALLGWALAHQRILARALIAFAIACASVNAYFLPGSSYQHKDFYGPFTNRQREEYLGITAPIRKSIEWLNANHPGATVLLAQDSYVAGLGGDVYENHWHQWNTMEQIRRASGMAELRNLLGRWKVEYVIARKPTTLEYAKPAALKDVLDNCTVPEYEFRTFYVARLEAECKALAPAAPLKPMLTAARGIYDDIDPYVLFRGDWDRSDAFDEAYRKTVAFTSTAGAEAAFAFEGDAMTYVYTEAPNRGIATITIDGVPKARLDLYSKTVHWQRRLRLGGLGPGRHVFVLHVTGEARPGAEGTFVDLDALEVH
jgi:glycosyltransferase involved in cell wall biosynthesis